MKTKNINNHTIHQQVERFFRHHLFMYVVLGIMAIALIKIDTKVISVARQAYAEGFGLLSMYMHHEETTRMPVNFGILQRAPTNSGR